MGELRHLITTGGSTSSLADERCVRSPEALWRRTTSGALVAVPDGGELLHLNQTASLVWDELAEPRSPSEVADAIARLCGRTPETIRGDIEQVLGQLVSRGAVWSAG